MTLSQGEIDDQPDGFVDTAFAARAGLRARDTEIRCAGYISRMARGGYPTALRRDTKRRRDRFYASYLNDLIVRDINQAAEIEHAADMRRLISLAAARSGCLLNQASIAGELSISAPTVRRYLQILELVHVIQLVPGWSSGATRRITAAPKVMFVDSGLAAYLRTGALDSNAVGGLLESFVMSELARQLSWSTTHAHLYHYRDRDRDRHEVDVVLEDDSGTVVAIEVKSAESVRAEDARGLRYLRDKQRRPDDSRISALLRRGLLQPRRRHRQPADLGIVDNRSG